MLPLKSESEIYFSTKIRNMLLKYHWIWTLLWDSSILQKARDWWRDSGNVIDLSLPNT